MPNFTGNLKTVAIAGLVAYILYLQQCSSCPETKPIVKTDTVRITHTDTVSFEKEVRTTVAKYIRLRDTVLVQGTPAKEFTASIEDSLLNGTITTLSTGEVLSQAFAYQPKFPKYIITTDSIIITNQVGNPRRTIVNIGIELGGNQDQFNLSPTIALGTKKGYFYGYRYGITDKTHNLGIAKTISFRKKNGS